MLIAAAAFALTIAAPPSTPPMIVHVTTETALPAGLVRRLMSEADAIWRSVGVTFQWRVAGEGVSTKHASPLSPAHHGAVAPTLRVVIGDDPGIARETGRPLGWILFEDDRPEQEIYVSYANASALLNESGGIVGHIQSMPRLQREMLLGRAMGRALAHEIGHYLSGAKSHTSSGLMMAVHTAAELFSSERNRFKIAPAEQQRIVARMTSIYIASRG